MKKNLFYLLLFLLLAGCTSTPKKLSKDEAIRLGDFTYLKPNHDERFTTDKDFYRNNEQGIIYQDGEPLIGLTFKKISTENTEAMKEYYTEAQLLKHQKNNRNIKLEVEIQNFNYSEPFDPSFMKFQMAFITDKGEEAYSISSLPLDPIKKGEIATYTFSIKLDERPVKDVDTLYILYYYIEDLLNLNLRTHSNHLEFDLDVTHEIDALDK
ncbi:hypothetical protein ACFQOY_08640 [Enterococcus alcedinis]|uniref:DUF5067 domain-containing protein n=1 Tax=Enterococcus alcedinis TaxID=1274384 RepID=A0A917JFW3_9ENTE|nr:hypothetical protein [Enterococcus alcedinis]MBP2101566.1 uncharacterized protein YcfL [Enterococcus alcedinis]GGI65040.1 hypothetical protein GCM10011482_06940 [Enterococcus alcedinis]